MSPLNFSHLSANLKKLFFTSITVRAVIFNQALEVTSERNKINQIEVFRIKSKNTYCFSHWAINFLIVFVK
jgi:hypothetical protein